MAKTRDWGHVIGKRIIRDVFSDNGILLVPISSIITREQIMILEKHGIELTAQDVVSIGPYSENESFVHTQIINDTVTEISRLFEGIRTTKEVPIAELRRSVIPIVQEIASKETPLIGLFASLQAKDDYIYRHHIAVGIYACLIGGWMGLDRQEQLQLTTAALLHDIGKMLIPEELLQKPGKLTAEEYAIMKSHTVLGYELLKKTVGVTHRQALVALQHHERMDGGGYPLGLTHDKIERFSRITSVADRFHAMTSRRAYQDPLPFYEVLFQIEKDSFGELDPVITRLFVEKMMNALIGRSVLLTDGREGVVLMVQAQNLGQPLIQAEDRFIDLSREPAIRIEQIL
ncbi:HD-GYP domain-containing protein [Paenibacillus nanensis]|uniref:HD-GYP domain-containing protein n=1 Tax=Paenibacillus nanensis TaxID=393251 RepID=UPI001F0BFF23|nr:HD-GYP domain-containing protein [Paenibacillus nanensis]